MTKPKEDNNTQIPMELLKELLTPSEMRMLKNRFKIILLLSKGLSIRAVAQRAKVGTDTVSRVAKMVDKEKLERIIKKEKTPLSNQSSTYIFGKSRV